jgi:hypothetical protein
VQGPGVFDLCPGLVRSLDSVEGECLVGLGVAASAGGDVGVSGQVQGASDQVADGGQDGGGVAGADLAVVFAEGDIADVLRGSPCALEV